jgi:copper resistance protein B
VSSWRRPFLKMAGCGLLLGAIAVRAQTPTDHAGHDAAMNGAGMDMSSMQGGAAPPDARDPHAWSEGAGFTRGDARPRFADEQSFRSILIDNFEVSRVAGETVLPYDLEAWFGRTYDRAVLKSEGDFEGGNLEEARTELLWGHAIAPYWDSQLGIRYDSGAGPNRAWLAAGIEGLAPYWFDLELTGYVGESSRTALRIDASYEILINQRLILEPRLEANFYGKNDIERGLGSGLADLSLALRLRYEIRRELAPYIGVEWINQYGGTEDLTRAFGGDPSDTRLTMGLRFWF